MGDFTIFISHRHEDQRAAAVIKEEIGQFSSGLDFFISGENIVPSEDWRERIRTELATSDLLLFLYTGSAHHWDWCLYEAGLFTSLDEDAEPIVCIHNVDDEPPAPLTSLQAVPARPDAVGRFIDQLIRTTELTGLDSPLNDRVTDEQIERSARRICDQFSSNVDRYYVSYRIDMMFPPDSNLDDGIPETSVVSASGATLALFGLGDGRHEWRALIADHLVQPGGEKAAWLSELDAAFLNATQRRVVAPTSRTFRAHGGARIFRPELYRLDFAGGRPVSAVVVVTEEVAPTKVGGPVFNLLRVSERYKAEVFDPYLRADARLSDDFIHNVREAMEGIKGEAKALGTFDAGVLEESFPDQGVRAQLDQISERWDEHTGALAAALEAQDSDAVQESLRRLRDANTDYRRITAARYAELLVAPAP